MFPSVFTNSPSTLSINTPISVASCYFNSRLLSVFISSHSNIFIVSMYMHFACVCPPAVLCHVSLIKKGIFDREEIPFIEIKAGIFQTVPFKSAVVYFDFVPPGLLSCDNVFFRHTRLSVVLNAGDSAHLIESCRPVNQSVSRHQQLYACFVTPVDIVVVGFGKKLHIDETLISQIQVGMCTSLEFRWYASLGLGKLAIM